MVNLHEKTLPTSTKFNDQHVLSLYYTTKVLGYGDFCTGEGRLAL